MLLLMLLMSLLLWVVVGPRLSLRGYQHLCQCVLHEMWHKTIPMNKTTGYTQSHQLTSFNKVVNKPKTNDIVHQGHKLNENKNLCTHQYNSIKSRTLQLTCQILHTLILSKDAHHSHRCAKRKNEACHCRVATYNGRTQPAQRESPDQ